jgi:hypothetical protein
MHFIQFIQRHHLQFFLHHFCHIMLRYFHFTSRKCSIYILMDGRPIFRAFSNVERAYNRSYWFLCRFEDRNEILNVINLLKQLSAHSTLHIILKRRYIIRLKNIHGFNFYLLPSLFHDIYLICRCKLFLQGFGFLFFF